MPRLAARAIGARAQWHSQIYDDNLSSPKLLKVTILGDENANDEENANDKESH